MHVTCDQIRVSLTADKIRAARVTNLYDFIVRNHPDTVIREGHSLRLIANHSVCVRQGYCGYTDFSTNETGNSIDFLTTYLGYSFVQAVDALTEGLLLGCITPQDNRTSRSPPVANEEVKLTELPKRDLHGDRKAIRYMQSRGIPPELSQTLLKRDLIYTEERTGNLVFLSRKRDFYEMRGTVPGSSFHQCKKANPDRCWAFRSGNLRPEQAMVCEGAIDALSLYLIRRMTGVEDGKTLYCGIGGVYNQKAIDRIARYLPVVIAVDHDEAGDACRSRNSQRSFLIPQYKDWNEDLCTIQLQSLNTTIV
ncbi:MAG: toprim domain-containing protein [Clostridia bacterium]|nr:toprim domain-containing protein [Clostridia bacterium]